MGEIKMKLFTCKTCKKPTDYIYHNNKSLFYYKNGKTLTEHSGNCYTCYYPIKS